MAGLGDRQARLSAKFAKLWYFLPKSSATDGVIFAPKKPIIQTVSADFRIWLHAVFPRAHRTSGPGAGIRTRIGIRAENAHVQAGGLVLAPTSTIGELDCPSIRSLWPLG